MDGIHDMGGMQGFGSVPVEHDAPVFHAPWEGRALGIVYLLLGGGVANIDAFRHAIERIPPSEYLTVGYYGRWLRAAETLAIEAGALRPGERAARQRGEPFSESAPPAPRPSGSGRGPLDVMRSVDAPPRFSIGEQVRTRNLHPRGHTRLPGYVREKRGVVHRVHPACVFPDTHAHGLGEDPQYVYAVRFSGEELFGENAERGSSVSVDLFESYLEPV